MRSLTWTWKTVMESSNMRTFTDIIFPNLEDTGVFSLESPPLIEWWSIWDEGVWWPACEPARPPCTPGTVGSPCVILYSSIIRFHYGSTTWKEKKIYNWDKSFIFFFFRSFYWKAERQWKGSNWKKSFLSDIGTSFQKGSDRVRWAASSTTAASKLRRL